MISELSFFSELNEIYACAQSLDGIGTCQEEGVVDYQGKRFPILSFSFGLQDPSAPKLVLIGGIHGLEKVGTHVVTAYLRSFIRLVKWDPSLQALLRSSTLIVIPLANPVGMYRRTRSNGNGVDLMRNSGVNAAGNPLPLVGGQSISSKLPWYRGTNTPEPETQILKQFFIDNILPSNFTVLLDIHSGFGLLDRLWFPYAYSKEVFPEAYRVVALMELLNHCFPDHIYKIEPQSRTYITHGDLWDYFYLEFENKKRRSEQVFIPLCLEMGSWHWIRKNPKQVLSPLGIFNPILPHRLKRIQRRHLTLIDFLLKAINCDEEWAKPPPGQKKYLEKKARERWY
ncbi:MAG: DUF2817 domain-containing protein [Pseudobacteriovorax sp.]|nr:DUF2817 domain-containing protein [Pseudobacteriovorax sp.]